MAQADAFSNLLQSFTGYDYDADGRLEITSLNPILTTDPPDLALDATSKLVVVLVEPRILDSTQGTLPTQTVELANRLRRLKADLVADGLVPRVVEAAVYDGSGPLPAVHQDGKTVLAVRRFLIHVRMNYPALQGALLVGSFPEALLVHEVAWFQTNTTANQFQAGNLWIQPGDQWFALGANVLNERSEVVLADLDGNWESIYQQGPVVRPGMYAIVTPTGAWPPPIPVPGTPTVVPLAQLDYYASFSALVDCFHIQDTTYTITTSGSPPSVVTNFNLIGDFLDPEANPITDAGFANRIARPEIFVSRINARNVATNPDPNWPFLDAGRPQAFTGPPGIPTDWTRFQPDIDLERRILLDYFDRNHRYRVGGYTTAVPYACVSFGLSASHICDEFRNAGLGSNGAVTVDASLVDYINWLSAPANSTTLRGIAAHSSGYNHTFGGNYADNTLAAITGAITVANPWRWVESPAGKYTPTLNGLQFQQGTPPDVHMAANADQFTYRTLWENGILASTSPALYIDSGCKANSPDGASWAAYNNPMYGRFQHAENILFYANGVALVSRAREFYDSPTGFGNALAPEKANFGAGWMAYYDIERNKADWFSDVPGRKKAYFWSEIGDWTVRKSYANGIGLLGVVPNLSGGVTPDADTVAADKTWLAGAAPNVGWNYDLGNANVKAVADFDGDAMNEFLLESTWGLGLIDRRGSRVNLDQHFAMVAGGPGGSAFGAWTYNRATDVIAATGDYDNDGREEVLVVSPSGLGILKYDDTQITSVMTAPNYTSFGGWILNTNDNNFFTMKRIPAGSRMSSRILITSSWGMAIFELSGSTLVPITSAQNGTKWGNWTVSTGGDVVQGIGDFDGDGRDDILIKSSGNLGILSLTSSNSKRSLMVKPNGSWFGGWRYTSSVDVIRKVADMDTDSAHKADILIRNPAWIGILSYSNGTLTSKMVQTQGTWFGQWQSSYSDVIEGVGDFTGDGLVDILVSNRNTKRVGVLTLSSGTLESKAIQELDGSLLGTWVQTPCMNIVGTGVFTEEGTAKYLAQPRPGDPCTPGTVLGDAWVQDVVTSTSQFYPRDFNVFVQGNVTNFHDVQGPVGGGSVTTTSFRVNSAWQQTGAVVSGAVSLAQGTVYGNVHCTGYPCGVASTVTVKGKVIGNPPIDFVAVFAKLQGLSMGLKGLPANGKVWKPYSTGLVLTGTDPDLNVFALDASAFQNTYQIELKVPSSSTAIINVGGAAVAINYAGMNVYGQNPSKILWNLYEATAFENKSMAFYGSVLAPLATVNLQWGSMSGTLVAAAANVQSEMYFHPFKGNWLVP
ncbi:MAG: choice-of-anchor A family protein [Deltaproteobacteria bacterium]|nr:choice-of-anchor A family protein [Deltaproteobacteria bacterium]